MAYQTETGQDMPWLSAMAPILLSLVFSVFVFGSSASP